jgi:molecular chaperone GrpE
MKDLNNAEDFESQDEKMNIENMAENQAGNNDEQAEANSAENLEDKFNELNDSYLRLHAEFDNYRKRTLKEKAELLKNGGEKVIIGLLPIIDDFERALAVIPEDAKEGFELIYNKFQSYLAQNGVKAIDAIGETFDTERHEAITTIPATSEEQRNVVIDCIQKGYTLNDKVIRFAKVIVAK